jgi:hypothetical protein
MFCQHKFEFYAAVTCKHHASVCHSFKIYSLIILVWYPIIQPPSSALFTSQNLIFFYFFIYLCKVSGSCYFLVKKSSAFSLIM